MRHIIFVWVIGFTLGCSSSATAPDAGPRRPANERDGGEAPREDLDGGALLDAEPQDGGSPDAPILDASDDTETGFDGGHSDAGPDGVPPDAGTADAGRTDAGPDAAGAGPSTDIVWERAYLDTSSFLQGIWGSGPNNVVAVGFSGFAFRWNGTTWSDEAIYGLRPDTYAVWGHSASDIWLGGDERNVQESYAADSWSDRSIGDMGLRSNRIIGGWSSSVSGCYAVTLRGDVLRHRTGRTWDRVTWGSTDWVLHDVWSSGPDEAWAVGSNGLIMRFRDSSWEPAHPSGTDLALLGIWGFGPNDIWAVGVRGLALHWDGTEWTHHPAETINAFNAVWGSGPNDMWAVGRGIFHWDGVSWTRTMSSGWTLNAIWGSSADDIWAVGEFGNVLHGTRRAP